MASLFGRGLSLILAASQVVGPNRVFADVAWRDVAEDDSRQCLAMNSLSQIEGERLVSAEMEIMGLYRLRDERARDRKGRSYKQAMRDLVLSYLSHEDNQRFSARYRFELLRLINTENLRQYLFTLGLARSPEAKAFSQISELRGFKKPKPELIKEVMSQLDRLVIGAFSGILFDLDRRYRSAPVGPAREKAIAARNYLLAAHKRDEVRELIRQLTRDLATASGMQQSEVDAFMVQFVSGLAVTIGSAVVIAATVPVGISFSALALTTSARALALAETSLGARVAAGCMIGAVMGGVSGVIASQSDKFVEAAWRSEHLGTSLSCELSAHQSRAPSSMAEQAKMGAGVGLLLGCVGTYSYFRLAGWNQRIAKTLVHSAWAIAAADIGLNAVAAKSYYDSYLINIEAYMAAERAALGDVRGREQHLENAKKYLSEALLARQNMVQRSTATITQLAGLGPSLRSAFVTINSLQGEIVSSGLANYLIDYAPQAWSSGQNIFNTTADLVADK